MVFDDLDHCVGQQSCPRLHDGDGGGNPFLVSTEALGAKAEAEVVQCRDRRDQLADQFRRIQIRAAGQRQQDRVGAVAETQVSL